VPHPERGSRRLRERVRADVARNRERIEGVGVGIITGAAGDDPAGIVTYTIVGATTGFQLLWLMVVSTPMTIAVQSTVARIAIVTGKSLPELTTAFYHRTTTVAMIAVLAVANILTIGADLDAVAAIVGIITGTDPVWFLLPVTALIGYLVVYGAYATIKRVLIALSGILIVYVVSAFLARPDLADMVRHTLVPTVSFDMAFILAALGLLGTTMSPYMMFWQAAEEREEHKTVAQARNVTAETAIGMSYSTGLAYFQIVAGAVTLSGVAVVTVTDVAKALEPLAGRYAFALFSIGIVVSGLLAIPVLAGSTAYAIADAFGWREGLDEKVSDARGFYVVFVGSMLLGALIDLSPVSAVDALYYSQVLDGLLLPFLVAVMLLVANNRVIMGEHTNSRFNNVFGGSALVVAAVLGIVMVVNLIG